MSEVTAGEIERALEVRFDSAVGDDATLRTWLIELLARLWTEGERFSGKRPFGDSGWKLDPAPALIRAGLIEGKLDEEYGWVDEVDSEALDRLVTAAIVSLADE